MHWMFCGIALHSFQINKSAHSYCVQGESSGRSAGYEGLNPSDEEPVQVITPPSQDYTGLVRQQPHGAGFDRHGYIEVIGEQEYIDRRLLVCTNNSSSASATW